MKSILFAWTHDRVKTVADHQIHTSRSIATVMVRQGLYSEMEITTDDPAILQAVEDECRKAREALEAKIAVLKVAS